MIKIKLFFVKILISFFRLFTVLGQKIVKLAKRINPPFVLFFKKIVWFFVYPGYKLVIFVKRRLFNIYTPAKSKIFSVLNKKYVLHVLMILLTLFVFVGNINAKEIRQENIGESSVVYSLFNDEFGYTLVEEKAIVKPEETVLSYIDINSQGASRSVYDTTQVAEADLARNMATITEGGSAVVRSNVADSEAVSTAQRNGTIKHTVEQGETISAIATRYGVSINTILWANDLSARSLIKPGMELEILPVSGVAHTVKSGETIKALANKYDVDEDKIISYNNLSSDGRINIGQDLVIPGGTKVTTVASRTYTTKTSTSTTSTSTSISKIFSPTVKGSSSGSGAMLWPTSWRVITQYYNWRHTGLDIDGDYNSPIYAAEDGVVIRAGWGTGYGNMYIVDHGGGVQTLYAHLSKMYAKNGDVVNRGDVLGMMGTTGWSTGTHLHFEVRINGVKKNPLSYIK